MSFLTDFISEVKTEIAILESRYAEILKKYESEASINDFKKDLEELFTDSRMIRFKHSDNEVVMPMFKEFIAKVYAKLIEVEQLVANNSGIN